MGFPWRRFAKLAELMAPLAMEAAGVPPMLTRLAVHGMQIAEVVGTTDNLTGVEKKMIAMDAVQTGLQALNAAKPGTVDVAAMIGLVSEGIDLTVQAVNESKNIPVHAETKTQGTLSLV